MRASFGSLPWLHARHLPDVEPAHAHRRAGLEARDVLEGGAVARPSAPRAARVLPMRKMAAIARTRPAMTKIPTLNDCRDMASSRRREKGGDVFGLRGAPLDEVAHGRVGGACESLPWCRRAGCAPCRSWRGGRTRLKAVPMSWVTTTLVSLSARWMAVDEVVDARGVDGIEARRRLVVEDDLGLQGQRAGQADALLHAAREVARAHALDAGQPHQLERLLDAREDLLVGHLVPELLAQAVGDVLADA